MDVRCSNCGTEYEFERERVPADGLSVKCSQCAHVFKVFPQEQGAIWRVRQQNGNIFEFRELTTLQRWIVERKVGRDDQISKGGRHWKRLGDIAELSAFFQVVEQAVRADARRATPGPMPDLSPPPGGWTLDDLEPPAPASYPPAPQAYVPALGAGGAAAGRRPSGPASRRPTPHQPGGFGGYRDTDPNLDLDPLPEREAFGRSGGAAKWVIGAVVLVACAAAAVYVLRPDLVAQLMGGGVPALAQSHVHSGWTELDRDSRAGIEEAISNFEKAVALAPTYPEAKAGLAEAHLARADAAVTEAAAIAARLALAGAPAGEAAPDVAGLQQQVQGLRAAADKDAERAFQIGKESLTLAPEALESNRAMASYYRLKKAPEQMEPLLDRAKAAAPQDPRLAFIIGASLVDDPEASERAARYLDTALEGAPHLQAARFKLASLYARQKDSEKALLHLDALLQAVPDHEGAKALLAVLRPAPAAAAAPAAPVAPPTPPAPPEPAKGEHDGQSLDKLVAKADRLRRADQPSKALPLYEQALELDPQDLDALTGLAWCHFDLERYDQAITLFKRVLSVSPRYTDAHMGLANSYEEKHMKRDAIKHYQVYLDILPDGPESAVARAAIQRLQ